jgi:hypothetical protein
LEDEFMNEKYDEWERNSQQWRAELDKALQEHGSSDVVTQYTNVAFAFPSHYPNPHSFDYPSIDERRLREWAEPRGWTVQLAPEVATTENKHHPPVRFTKG